VWLVALYAWTRTPMGDGGAWPRRPQEPAHSRRGGPARHDDGERTTAYRALGALACAHCARVMDVGELFSRHARSNARGKGWGVTLRPLCGSCRPLRLEGDENEAQHEG